MASPTASIAPSLLAAVADELRRYPPFDRMEPPHLPWMVQRLCLGYHAPGSVVLEAGAGVPRCLYIVKQGTVAGESALDGARRWELGAGDCFPLGALLGERPVTSVYRAQGDTFCYELAAVDFARLMEASAVFREFCIRGLASLLASSRRALQSDSASELSRDPLDQPLGQLIRRAPVTCGETGSVREALERMRSERVGSILIVDEAQAPRGIFTLRDLRDRVLLEDGMLERPIAQVMSAPPNTLPHDALAFEAALVMAEHGFHHMIVTREGKAAGVLSESDLFALQRIGVSRVSAAIRAAAAPEVLPAAAADIRLLAANLLAQGVAADQLTRIVSTLTDRLTARLLELELARAGWEPSALCWIALGSEGRHEQTLSSDQDNAIVFPDPEDGDAEGIRASLLPLARRVNEGLAACGYPLCRGDVMAGNPRYCQSLTEWKRTFAAWLNDGNTQALLDAAIAFDFRPLFGATHLAQALRGWLAATAPGRPLFLRLMAENALRNQAPLGLFRDFATAEHAGRPGTLDLKLNGIMPFVDAARIVSLGAGDFHTNTAERLRAAAAARRLDAAEVEAWIEAFHFLQLLRLRNQQARWKAGEPPDNLLDPERLNELDRRILKEAFRQARKVQQRLKLDYQL